MTAHSEIHVNAGSMITTTGGGSVTLTGLLAGPGTVNLPITIESGGRVSPGASPGTLSTAGETWKNGGVYLWEISDVAAGAGTGSDLLNIAGTLDLASLGASGFTIDIHGLTAGLVPGTPTGFTPDTQYAWTIASASTGINGFNAANFAFTETGYAFDKGAAPMKFVMEQSDNNLVLAMRPGAAPSLIREWKKTAATSDWATGGNWDLGVPDATLTARFNDRDVVTTPQPLVSANAEVKDLEFTGLVSGWNIGAGGGAQLTVVSGNITTTGAAGSTNTIEPEVVFGGTSATITVAGDATHNLHLVAALNMPGKTLAKEGPGTLTTAAITAGTVNHNAGTLNAASVTAGTFNVNSTALVTGLVNVSGTTTVAVGKSLTAAGQTGGDLTVYGAAGYGTGAVGLTGTATVGNGTALAAFTAGAVTANHFNVASGTAQMTTLTGTNPATSTVSVAAGHTMTVGAGITNVNAINVAGDLITSDTVRATSVTEELLVATGGKWDLNDGLLVVNYSGASPVDEIRQWINDGYNGGDWLGATGITSSGAAANPVLYAIGYVDNAQLSPEQRFTTFGGVAVGVNSVLVRYTWAADVTLDGQVTDADVTVIGANYDGGATTGRYWWEGDLTGDGRISDADVTILGALYARGAVSDGGPVGLGLDSGGLGAVPEPATLCLMLLGGMAMLARRRRRAGR